MQSLSDSPRALENLDKLLKCATESFHFMFRVLPWDHCQGATSMRTGGGASAPTGTDGGAVASGAGAEEEEKAEAPAVAAAPAVGA